MLGQHVEAVTLDLDVSNLHFNLGMVPVLIDNFSIDI